MNSFTCVSSTHVVSFVIIGLAWLSNQESLNHLKSAYNIQKKKLKPAYQ
jgi:hypothetical protein